MSAPLKLTPRDVQMLADAMAALTEMTRKTGVEIDAYGPADVQVNADSVVKVRWIADDRQYVIDDQVGS